MGSLAIKIGLLFFKMKFGITCRFYSNRQKNALGCKNVHFWELSFLYKIAIQTAQAFKVENGSLRPNITLSRNQDIFDQIITSNNSKWGIGVVIHFFRLFEDGKLLTKPHQ